MAGDKLEFREERFLFHLPYDARLARNFVNHVKDDLDPRESGWTMFDLQTWLGLDSPPVEGTLRSTTLIFSAAQRRADPMYFVERAFPSFFELSRKMIHPRRRWLYSRPMRWLKDQLQRSGPLERHTVVLAVRIDVRPDTLTEEWRFSQLHKALDRLNDFLLAAASVHGDPELAPVAPQDLPPVVFGMGWDLPRYWGEFPRINFWTYLLHDRIPDRPRDPLTRAEADLAMWMTVERDHPLTAPSHLFLSAQQAMHRGRLTHSIVDSGTAVEMLVAAAVRLLASDQGYSAAKLENVLKAPFANLLRDHFASFLGYSRELDTSDDALGIWWRDGYKTRNSVVHEGRKPTEEEAAKALGSALQLQRDFVERLRAEGFGDKLPQVPAEVKHAADARREQVGEWDY